MALHRAIGLSCSSRLIVIVTVLVFSASTMKVFVVLSGLMAVAMARPNLVQLLPRSSQASAAASASASSSPQRLSLLQTLPGLTLEQDPRLVDTLEVRIADAGHETVTQRVQTNKHNVLGLTRIISTKDAAPVGPDGRVRDTFEVTLAKAEHEAAHRNERILLAEQEARAAAAQAQSQQQVLVGPNSLLSSTRQAQSLASVNPLGASSVSSAQIFDSPQLNAARIAQQQALASAATRQALGLQSAQPLLLGLDGQLVLA